MHSLPLYLIKKGGDYMKGGFSFCGVDIAEIGLEYAPENKDTYVYAPNSSEIHDETFEGHNGGYIYGSSRKPKEFTLRCFYQDSHIAHGNMALALNLFRVGKSGKLIFQRRPWCYYYATVISVDTSDMFNYMNGLIVITMKAYYPFARGLEVKKNADSEGHLLYNLKDDPYHDEIMENTALFDNADMMPITEYDLAPNGTFLLYNPGTERATLGIVIAGTAGDDGIIIGNNTTGQKCKYSNFETGQNENQKYIYTDGINGKTILYNNGVKELAFLYHDYGFIELEPAFPILRNIYVSYSGNTVTCANILYQNDEEREWYIGKYIYLKATGKKWFKIVGSPNKHTLTVTGNSGTGSLKTSVALMNEMQLTISQNTNIRSLKFLYKPTYA